MKSVMSMVSKIKGGGTLITSILVIGVLGVLLFLILNRNQKLKYLKKLTSVALILTMLLLPFTNLLNVKAEEVTIATDDNKTMTGYPNRKLVTNEARLYVRDVETANSFSAYKVLDTYYEENTNQIFYDFTTEFKSFIDQLPSDDEFSNYTVEKYQELTSDSDSHGYISGASVGDVNKIVSKYASYIKKNNLSTTGTSLEISDNPPNHSGSKGCVSAVVKAGSYIILPTSITETTTPRSDIRAVAVYTYGVMIGNVEFKVENGAWTLPYVSISAKYSDEQIVGFVMNATFSELLEIVNSALLFDCKNTEYAKSKNLYLLEMNGKTSKVIPENAHSSIKNYPDISKLIGRREYIFPKGINYDINNIMFMGADADDMDDFKLKIRDGIAYYNNGDQEKTYAYVEEKANEDGSKSIFFSPIDTTIGSPHMIFTLTTDDNVVLGTKGNTIETKVTYLKEPYIDIIDPSDTQNPNGDISKALGTASYTNAVYTYGVKVTNQDSNGNNLIGGKFAIYTDEACTEENKVGETSVIDDIIQFKGINSKDTYYLKQISAPTGYKLAEKIKLEPASIDVTSGYYDIKIVNAKAGLLPSTGGLGTIFYTLIGLAVIGLGAYEVIKYSKKTSE